MTDEEAMRRAQIGEPIYHVFCFDHAYYVGEGKIVGFGGIYGYPIEYEISSDYEGKITHCARDLYETPEDAQKVADNLQSKYGKRIVPESEYKEFIKWKKERESQSV